MANATNHYTVIHKLKEVLMADPSVNSVTYGNIYDLGVKKTNMYPLSHFTVNNVRLTPQTHVFNMTLFCTDLINFSKEDENDSFTGNDNIMDIHNTQLAVISRAMLLFRRQDMINLNIRLVGEPTFEAFKHQFNNDDLAGWFCDFEVEILQDMNVC